ncbi:MAG TPA: hypothetical protein VMG60_10215 [Burkholderiaceae bacterium]|nr:hypothetical protein [Burkholderiaceae bacterium]
MSAAGLEDRVGKSKWTVLGRFVVLAGAALCAASAARAEYRCDPPPREIDRVACLKAAEGPEALREYIRKMRDVETLYFYDYVNEERLVAWRKMERRVEPPVLERQARQSAAKGFGISKVEIPRVRSG